MKTFPLTDANIDDAQAVIRDRFDEAACALLDKELRNPLRKLCPEAGDIVYDDDGRPICFQACVLRRLYLGQEPIVGKVGGMFCLRHGAPVEAVIDVRAAGRKSRGGSVIGFGNSQRPEAAGMAKRTKNTLMGPVSCERYIWAAIRPLECLGYFFRRKVLKIDMPSWPRFDTLSASGYATRIGDWDIRRIVDPRDPAFDTLMKRYLETNEGLFCSRTAEEIDWMFGDRIRDGRNVVLMAFKNDEPIGYVMVDGARESKRWMLADLFAVRNDAQVIDSLLSATKRFLRKHTPAMMLETAGFPMFIQPVLTKHLPHVRKFPCNLFSWGSQDKNFREKVIASIEQDKSWFFGPYDGDLVMYG